MKADRDREMVGEELAFARANDALLVKSLDQTRSFAEAVDDYRRLEAEFLARAGADESKMLETKRRIAETIVAIAHHKRPPFEACREAWNDLARLGFTNIEQECTMAWFYAECCAYDEQHEEGLAVLRPLIAKLELGLEQARGTVYPARFYEKEIESLGDLRDELEAQQRGEVIPWRETRRADEAYQITPEEEQADVLYDEFWEARRAVFKTYARTWDRSFADIAHDYRKVEADFLARIGSDKAFEDLVLEVRRQIAEDILNVAYSLQQPFDVCRQAWDEAVRLGFSSTSKRWRMTEKYAKACEVNDQPEAGLAVVEPLMAEITRRLEEPKKKLQPPPRCTRVELTRELEDLTELRDKLKAKRRDG